MAAQQYLQGEAVFVGKGAKNCIVQTGKPNPEGKYEVKCGKDNVLVAPASMRSNPDQTKTSRTFVCPGGGKPCYFKP
jgi:hypothetical protein